MLSRYIASRTTGLSIPILSLVAFIGVANPDDYADIRCTKAYARAEKAVLPIVRSLMDGESAHTFALLSAPYLGVRSPPPTSLTPLSTTLKSRSGSSSLHLRNCVGLAAGFSKDGDAAASLLAAGFGSVEVGSTTPEPQPGNERPRVFRLEEDRAVINRYGFNSLGHGSCAKNLELARAELARYSGYRGVPLEYCGSIGVNLGKNKTTENAKEDYVKGIEALASLGDYLVINVSSPNTPGLRGLQSRSSIRSLMSSCVSARNAHAPDKLLFVKVAPDLTDSGIDGVVEAVVAEMVDGVIVGNTTVGRAGVSSPLGSEGGGLSGAPLRSLSTDVVRKFHDRLAGTGVHVIGCGGVSTGAEAYEKIRAGACAVQLYTGLTYGGLGMVEEIKEELERLLERDGYGSVAEAVGKG